MIRWLLLLAFLLAVGCTRAGFRLHEAPPDAAPDLPSRDLSARDRAPGDRPADRLPAERVLDLGPDPAPAALTLEGPATLGAGTCGDVLVHVVGASKLPAPVLAPTTVLLAGGSGGLFSDAACTVPTSTLVIPAGGSSAGFRFRQTKAGVWSLSAADQAQKLASALLEVTVVAGAVAPSGCAIGGSGPVVADTVATAAVTILLRDAFGNGVAGVVPAFAATGAGNSYGACSATGKDGSSSCTLASASAGTKTLSIVSPVSVTGSTVVFTGITLPGCALLKQQYGTYLLGQDLGPGQVKATCLRIAAPDVTLDCQGHAVGDPNLEATIIYSDQPRATIRNCAVTASAVVSTPPNGNGRGIQVTGQYALVEKNTVKNCFFGIEVVGSHHSVKGNVVEGNAKGIHLLDASDSLVVDNLVKNNSKSQGWGLAIWRGSRNKLTNNNAYGNTYNLVLYEAADIDIMRCGVLPNPVYVYPGCSNIVELPCSGTSCTWAGDVCQ